MFDPVILKRAILVSVAFEFLLVLVGHYFPRERPHFLLFGCMMAAGVAGLLYARDLKRGFGLGALGGGLTGAAGGLTAVAGLHLLGDPPELLTAYAVIILAFVGAVGGLFGQLDAVLQRMIRSL